MEARLEDDFVLVDSCSAELCVPSPHAAASAVASALASDVLSPTASSRCGHGDSDIEDLTQLEVPDGGMPSAAQLFRKLEKCLELYGEQRLFDAKKLFDEAKAAVETTLKAAAPGEVPPYIEKVQQMLSSNPVLSVMEKEVDAAKQLLEQANDANGWTLMREGKDVRVYHRQQPSNISTIKVEGVLDVDLPTVLALAHSDEYLPKLAPTDVQVKQLGKTSPLRQAVYFRIKLMWPFDDRDLVLNSQVIDCLEEEGQVIVAAQSVRSNDGWDITIPACSSACVRLDIRSAGVVLKVLSKSTTGVTALFNIDQSFNSVPSAVMSQFRKTLAYMAFDEFRKGCHNILSSSDFQLADGPLTKQLQRAELYLSSPRYAADVQQRLEAAQGPNGVISPRDRSSSSSLSPRGPDAASGASCSADDAAILGHMAQLSQVSLDSDGTVGFSVSGYDYDSEKKTILVPSGHVKQSSVSQTSSTQQESAPMMSVPAAAAANSTPGQTALPDADAVVSDDSDADVAEEPVEVTRELLDDTTVANFEPPVMHEYFEVLSKPMYKPPPPRFPPPAHLRHKSDSIPPSANAS